MTASYRLKRPVLHWVWTPQVEGLETEERSSIVQMRRQDAERERLVRQLEDFYTIFGERIRQALPENWQDLPLIALQTIAQDVGSRMELDLRDILTTVTLVVGSATVLSVFRGSQNLGAGEVSELVSRQVAKYNLARNAAKAVEMLRAGTRTLSDLGRGRHKSID